MKRDAFEKKVLELWIESRVPLTLVNVSYWTGASRRKAEDWLDDLVREDVLDMIVGNDGTVRWKVRGARRPLDGAPTFEELEKRSGRRGKGRKRPPADDDEGLLDDLDRLRSAANTAMAAKDVRDEIKHGPKEGEKSMLVSGGVSLLFGPLGWLYAGAWKEAIPGSLIYLALLWLLPSFLLWPILGVVAPISGIAGLMYAWKYNKTGTRQPILPQEDDPKALPE